MMGEPRKRPRASTRILAVILGSMAGVALALATLAFFSGERLAPLTREAHTQALARWRSAGVSDYDLEIQVSGVGSARYEVAVRGGQVARATRNGRPLTRAAVRDAWSVKRMFDVIDEDLRIVELAEAGRAPPGMPRLSLHARWHPQWGYAQRYRRVISAQAGGQGWAQRVATESGAGGAAGETVWEIVRFTPQR